MHRLCLHGVALAGRCPGGTIVPPCASKMVASAASLAVSCDGKPLMSIQPLGFLDTSVFTAMYVMKHTKSVGQRDPQTEGLQR